jgi:biotin synthase
LNNKDLIEKVKQQFCSAEDIAGLLMVESDDKRALFAAADAVRKKYHGERVKLRGIIEFSNYCANNCWYCGLRADNKNISRYRYSAQEIVDTAKTGIKLGYGTIVLQAGEDNYFDGERIAAIVRSIKQFADVAITISAGILRKEEYQLLKVAGADRYLMKHETANAELFAKLRPDTTLKERLENLQYLKSLGFWIGSGMMIGLPGTTIFDVARDILLLKATGVEMAGIGPFVAHPSTPLGADSNGSVELTLKALAVSRLLMPTVHLPATTALGTLDKTARVRALMGGANVIMPNISPKSNRANYEIYPNKAGTSDDAESSHEMMMKIIADAGRVPALFEK